VIVFTCSATTWIIKMTDLNLAGESYAHSLIAAGKVDRTSAWSFDAADGNALLGRAFRIDNGKDRRSSPLSARTSKALRGNPTWVGKVADSARLKTRTATAKPRK
jgi:hypothetical protein